MTGPRFSFPENEGRPNGGEASSNSHPPNNNQSSTNHYGAHQLPKGGGDFDDPANLPAEIRDGSMTRDFLASLPGYSEALNNTKLPSGRGSFGADPDDAADLARGLNFVSARGGGEKFMFFYRSEDWFEALRAVHQWHDDVELSGFKGAVPTEVASAILGRAAREGIVTERQLADGISMRVHAINYEAASGIEISLHSETDRLTVCAVVGGAQVSQVLDAIEAVDFWTPEARHLFHEGRDPIVRYLHPLDSQACTLNTCVSARRGENGQMGDFFILICDAPSSEQAKKILNHYASADPSQDRVLYAKELTTISDQLSQIAKHH